MVRGVPTSRRGAGMDSRGSPRNSNGSRSLKNYLEEQIRPLVMKYQDEQDLNGGPQADLGLRDEDSILAYIRSKDLTLSRKPQQNLRNALANVIRDVRSNSNQDNGDSDQESDSDSAFDADVPMMEVKDTNSLNRSILGVYGQHKPNSPAPSSSAPTNGTPAADAITDGPVRIVSEVVEETSAESKIGDGGRTAIVTQTNKRRQKDSLLGSESKKAKRSTISAAEKWATPTARLSDLGGMDNCVEEVLQLIGMPLKHPEIYLHLGIQPPRGILLHGPPGCGKTALAHAIAGEAGVPFVNISAPSIVSGMSGESEKKLREIFDEAKELAPCLLFIDEIDAITPKRETAQREMERRIVAQLLTCLDDISMDKTDNKPVIVIGATNRPDSLDSALRRAGRFDREISIGVPDEKARAKILEKLCCKLRLSGDLNVGKLAKMTPGYVGADLNALTAEAGMSAVKRIFSTIKDRSVAAEVPAEISGAPPIAETPAAMDIDIPTMGPAESAEEQVISGIQEMLTTTTTVSVADFLAACPAPLTPSQLSPLCIISDDFTLALKKVQPSAKREGFATVPDVSWDDIGALTQVRDELRMAVVEPMRHPEFFERMGIGKAMGVLLYGPPGCGKTLLAKAVANESHCNFISVKGPELLNKYVGESEKAVRMVFARAQASSPCVIFFDELDALCPARSNEAESQSSSRLVNTLLTEMDGMGGRKQVYVLAATNRPDMIDPAMLRPGRLDKALYVDFPTAPERSEILKAVTRQTPLGDDVDLEVVAADPKCDGYSGADLAALVREAAVAALREGLKKNGGVVGGPLDQQDAWVRQRHFLAAFSKMAPSVGKKDRRRYELLRVKFGATPANSIEEPVV